MSTSLKHWTSKHKHARKSKSLSTIIGMRGGGGDFEAWMDIESKETYGVKKPDGGTVEVSVSDTHHVAVVRSGKRENAADEGSRANRSTSATADATASSSHNSGASSGKEEGSESHERAIKSSSHRAGDTVKEFGRKGSREGSKSASKELGRHSSKQASKSTPKEASKHSKKKSGSHTSEGPIRSISRCITRYTVREPSYPASRSEHSPTVTPTFGPAHSTLPSGIQMPSKSKRSSSPRKSSSSKKSGGSKK